MRTFKLPARTRWTTVELSNAEHAVLDQLAAEKQMSTGAIMRIALRIYQEVAVRRQRGETMGFYDATGQRIVDPVGGCMGDDD